MKDNKVYNFGDGIKKLTDDELSQLFHICREHTDLFLKLLPGHPWLELVKKDPSSALKGLVWIQEQK